MIEFDEKYRPQDDKMDGSDLTFQPSEYGGDLPDMMPQVIIVTDKDGKKAVYSYDKQATQFNVNRGVFK